MDQCDRVFTGSNLQFMVVTVGAINKKEVNNLYKDSEKTGGEQPIDLIRSTQPILIIDEPQSVDGGLEGRGKEALFVADQISNFYKGEILLSETGPAVSVHSGPGAVAVELVNQNQLRKKTMDL